MISTNITHSFFYYHPHITPDRRDVSAVNRKSHRVPSSDPRSPSRTESAHFNTHSIYISILIALGAFTASIACFTSNAEAIPPQSITTSGQGLAQVDESLPWISGWDLDGRARNVQKLLQLKPEEVRAIYLVLCHTKSSVCVEKLRFIQSMRGVLESEGIDTILIFTEDISSGELSTWLELRGILPSPRFQVLIDRFHRSALRLGAYQDVKDSGTLMRSNMRDNSSGRRQDTRPQESSEKRLHVPLGILVSPQGKVLTIVVQAGADLVDRISESLRYLTTDE